MADYVETLRRYIDDDYKDEDGRRRAHAALDALGPLVSPDKQAVERLARDLTDCEQQYGYLRIEARAVAIYLDQALRGVLTDGYGAREARGRLWALVKPRAQPTEGQERE